MIRNNVMLVNCCACFVFQRTEMFEMKQQVNLIKQLFDSKKRLSQVNGFYDLKEEFCREDISVHMSVFNTGNVCVGSNQLP